jgi:HD-like signal output (HDOD) protein
MTALQREESTAGEIERIILLDSALAAATLRLANSASVASAEPIGSVEQAIVMLGHRELYRIASLSLVSRWEEHHHKALPWEPGDYTRHSLCTALAAEVIAEGGDQFDPPMSYTVGLVCDVGKLVMAYVGAAFYPRVTACLSGDTVTWEEAERSVFGYDHAEVGARLLRSWRFPEHFAQAVEFQLKPEAAPPEVVPLVAQLHAARYVAVCLGPGVTEGGFLFNLRGSLLSEFGYTSELLEKVMVDVRDRAIKRLGDRLAWGLVKTK